MKKHTKKYVIKQGILNNKDIREISNPFISLLRF